MEEELRKEQKAAALSEKKAFKCRAGHFSPGRAARVRLDNEFAHVAPMR